MPNFTPNLQLAKPLGNETVDIAVLNENADKLDSEITGVKSSISAVNGKTAADISILDSANRFTATNVDGALNELFTSADNGRKSVASAIGAPAVASDTYEQLSQRVQTIKNTLATNLTNKGQASNGSETLTGLVDKVANITTMHTVVEGSWSGDNGDPIPAVTGLPKRPKLVWIDRWFSGAGVLGPSTESPEYGFPNVPITITNDGFTCDAPMTIAYPETKWKVLY